MAGNYGESDLWRRLNTELFDAEEFDLSDFKNGRLNNRIAAWDIQANALRFYKTLLFQTARTLNERQLGILDRVANHSMGAPIEVTIAGRPICMDYLQAVLEVDFMAPALEEAQTVLEIGSGYGRTCHTTLSAYQNIHRYIIVDLEPCLRLSHQYLKSVLDDTTFSKIVFIPNSQVEEAEADLSHDLAINIDSMAEMNQDVVHAYQSFIHRRGRWFFSKNPIGKFQPQSLGITDVSNESVQMALRTGILCDVLDIFDDRVIAGQAHRFLELYRPSEGWSVYADRPALPWSYYHQALFRKDD